MMQDSQKSQTSRTLLGVLLAILAIAVILTLYSCVSGGDGNAGSNDALPTPITLPTSTPVPEGGEAVAAPVATAAPVVAPTAVPEGFEACTDAETPLTTGTYIVDTNTTPLNQREQPDVTSEQAGTFDPQQADLVFTGNCVVNSADGYVWWEIFNGTADVWIASDFVSPN